MAAPPNRFPYKAGAPAVAVLPQGPTFDELLAPHGRLRAWLTRVHEAATPYYDGGSAGPPLTDMHACPRLWPFQRAQVTELAEPHRQGVQASQAAAPWACQADAFSLPWERGQNASSPRCRPMLLLRAVLRQAPSGAPLPCRRTLPAAQGARPTGGQQAAEG